MVLSGSSKCYMDIFAGNFRDSFNGNGTQKSKEMCVLICGNPRCYNGNAIRNYMYDRLLRCRGVNSIWVLFFQRTKMVVFVRANSYTLLDKYRITRRLDVSGPIVWCEI